MILKEDVLAATDRGAHIFEHLITNLPKDWRKGKMFKAYFRDDGRKASAQMKQDEQTGDWLYKDYADGPALNAIDFVAKAKNVDFAEAVKLASEYANISVEQINRHKKKEAPIKYLLPDKNLVAKAISNQSSALHVFLLSIGISSEHLAKWGVGTNDKGQTAFVFQDNSKEALNIKSMTYLPTGKRDKNINALSLYSHVEGEKYKLCLFGEHLLGGKPVCIVESEKTAVIASWHYPEYDWIATGGAQGGSRADYTRNNLSDGRQCLVLLDADPVRKTPKALTDLLAISARAETVDLFPDRADKTDIADYILEGLHPEIVKDKVKIFWKKTDKALDVMHTRFGRFLEENDFLKYYPAGSNDFEFCKIDGKFVDITSESRIKDFVLDYVKKPEFGEEVSDFFIKNTNLFNEQYLSSIGTKSFEIQRDTKDEGYLYYENCVVRVSKNKIETLPYSQVGGYVWQKHVIKRDFNKKDDGQKAEYERFIEFISGNEVKMAAFKSAIGYMMHEYRSPSKAKCVILNDSNLDAEPKGGAGKGIFCAGLSYVRRVAKIDAKQFDANSTFAYESVDPTDQIVEFSDADKKMDFEKLFNVITDGFRIGRKYKDPIILPASKSPKIILTTNYAIKGRGGASRRRRYELEFTDHFHEGWTAEDEFKHNLFIDWDKAEWERFDRFMVHCLQFYLEHSLIEDVHETLARKTLEANTSIVFREWCESPDGPVSKLDTHHYREDLLSSYLSANPEHRSWMQWGVMKKYLEYYCDYAGLEMKEGNTVKRWCRFSKKPDAKRPEPQNPSMVQGVKEYTLDPDPNPLPF